jgi:hypothetical protein
MIKMYSLGSPLSQVCYLRSRLSIIHFPSPLIGLALFELENFNSHVT